MRGQETKLRKYMSENLMKKSLLLSKQWENESELGTTPEKHSSDESSKQLLHLSTISEMNHIFVPNNIFLRANYLSNPQKSWNYCTLYIQRNET